LASGDALGGFFALGTRAAESVDPSWRPVTDLLGGDVLDRRIDEVAEQLGGTTRRIAASLLELSLASRPAGILLAAAAEHRVLPHLPAVVVQWRPWSGGPVPLWVDLERVAGTALGAPDDPDTAAAVADELAEVHIAPLVDAVRACASVSARVLWGNAASAFAGAVRVLAIERPTVRDDALALARGVLACPPFEGLGSFLTAPSHPTGVGFARRTCCLFYRVPDAGTCEDCVLAG
jgi:ferric iron reductase protein FhuF